MCRSFPVVLLLCLTGTAAAGAQEPLPPRQGDAGDDIPGISRQWHLERVAGDLLVLDGAVEYRLPDGRLFMADHIEILLDESFLVAEGSVVFAGAEGRVTASRVEFDYERNTGWFYDAWGTFPLGAQADPAQFAGQDADFYLWGETLEKIGPREYRLTNGGFTTCTQPEPRWQISTGTLTVDLDRHASAWNTVLRVKNVPILWAPYVRYPIQDEERSTGFLMPSYGTSTVRGQAVSNAFFWELGRSHDATIFHDWFTRTGQGTGVEYRYVAAEQSSGTIRAYRLDQHEAQFTQNGVTSTLPAAISFDLTGSLNHQIRQGVRARARLDYFSDVTTQQLYHQEVARASENRRLVEGGLTASLGPTFTTILYQRRELLSGENRQLYGNTPRVSTTVAPQRLFGAPVYASVNAEYAFLPSRRFTGDTLVRDDGYSRMDVSPSIRMPMSRLPYLSINTSATYRSTRYSRSVGTGQSTLDEPYLRQYASLRSEIVGPVLNRIWDRPESRFAERLKHVIEPAFTLDATSRFSDHARTPTTADLSDFVVSGAYRVTYGVTNRLFARGRTEGDAPGQAREFVTVGLQQTWYSNPESARSDSTYQSTYYEDGDRDLSPVALTARVSPSGALDANLRAEYDVSTGGGLRMLSAGGRVNLQRTSTSLSYSRSRRGTDVERDTLNASTSLRWLDGRATGTYAFVWDIGRSELQSQTVTTSYLAQCCGIQLEFQRYNFPAGYPIDADTRFNLGVVLAGLGTFSNFFGALGGQQ